MLGEGAAVGQLLRDYLEETEVVAAGVDQVVLNPFPPTLSVVTTRGRLAR